MSATGTAASSARTWRTCCGGCGGSRLTDGHGAAGRTTAPAGGTGPVFILASATISEPGRCAKLLTGLDAEEVTEDSAPHGPFTFASGNRR